MSTTNNDYRLNAFFDCMTTYLSNHTTPGHGPAKERQLMRMRKRARFVTSGLEEKAVFDFLHLNFRMKGHRHSLPNDIVIEAKRFITTLLENRMTRLADYNIQQTLDRRLLLDYWRFGPGSSYGVVGSHIALKIEQPMTTTDINEPNVKRLRATTPYFYLKDQVNGDGGTRTVLGSKLSTVPKNEETMRTIAIEPSGNMCLQLAAGRILEDALRDIGLDIRNQQDKNKVLARIGSIDGSLATIDLSSASDMISPDLVRALMPDAWQQLITELRSPLILVNKEWVPTNMISTMGNGFTFPLMTLLLVALIYSMRRSHSGPNSFVNWTDTAVFGDDIIIPTREFEEFCSILEKAGLKVNASKSYQSGPFRESCGGDYWEGVDITPFYVKSLRVDSDIYVAINQLCMWSAKTGSWPVVPLRLLISYLRNGPYFVPFWLGDTSGIKTSRVGRRYKHLAPVKSQKPYLGDYMMMLACGSYITDHGAGPCYSPRVRKDRIRYSTRNARLPKGYLDGSEATIVVSERHKSHIDLLLDLCR